MIRFVLLFSIGFFNIQIGFTQAEADSAQYQAGFDLLGKAKTTENYLEAAFYFGQLANQYPQQWLGPYYAGLAYIQASQKALTSNYKDELLDKAQIQIDKAAAIKPGGAELQILQAFLFQSRIQVNTQVRGINYSKKADAMLKMALTADPSNPRALFLQACNVYYTPAVLKGGAKNALPMFIKARDKFRTYIPASPYMPDWGERENQEMINLCNNPKK